MACRGPATYNLPNHRQTEKTVRWLREVNDRGKEPRTAVGQAMWFDGQAEQFDDSAGLDPAVGRSIARAILQRSGATGDDVILDIGTGTGAVGLHFAALPNRYFGLDLSR